MAAQGLPGSQEEQQDEDGGHGWRLSRGGGPGERQQGPVRGPPPGLILGLRLAQNHSPEGGGRSPATTPGPQMAAPAGREEGHPPGCTRALQAQAGLGAINHPPPIAGKQPGGLASAGPHPSGPRRQMLGEAGWEALQEGEAEQQIPGPRVASHTRAQHNHRPLKATEPPHTLVGGAGRRQGRGKTANGTLGCQDIRGLRHQSLSPNSTQGHQSALGTPAASLPQGPLSSG